LIEDDVRIRQANYNVLFRSPTGTQSQAQIEAFEDTWHWNSVAEQAFDEVMQSGNGEVAEMLRAFRSFLKENDMMAYLTMMAVRLIELHRVLKSTGSLYLHCDPTAIRVDSVAWSGPGAGTLCETPRGSAVGDAHEGQERDCAGL
jgi:hypothetical protein